mmetsp:Transcript_20236/g.39291  ORF Transcript_20236/g.39291 Transcript_20236/m.39291 type:complete len:143 (+) Transcript_20236:91-519(+)
MSGWSTGLLAFWDDFETMLNGTVMCGAMVVLMPARTNLDLVGGTATCGFPSTKIMPCVEHFGCSEQDAAYCVNLSLCVMCPLLTVFWRKQMRDMYSIKGSVPGDLLACALCFPCMAMQEARELKMRETGRLYVPQQLDMHSR